MVGANTFLDYDLSRDHARMGLGAEYWRDFMKLGANSYLRLTSWKNSADFDDFEERPANGWDLRAEAYLPAYPQLGGKLIYEQYYGKDVALFGKDSLQSNPHAITAGVNYTPFPLLTFNAEQRQGKAGEHDTRFGLQLNYQLGVAWQQQTSPDAVHAMRSLIGSRYDLVDRNNNIVLEYRKKEVIRLHSARLLTGYAGQKQSLGVAVNSKYGLDQISWSAPDFLQHGGKILHEGGLNYQVVLPDYQSGPGATNSYVISGVAVDKKGNSSRKSETQVTVTQAAINEEKSSLTPAAITLPADGKTQQALVLTISDGAGKPVDIAEDEISITREAKQRGTATSTITAFKRQGAGEYIATITAGTQPESFSITPAARNTRFPSSSVTLTADNTTAHIDSMDVVVNKAIADGKAQNKVKLTVADSQGNRVPNQPVTLRAGNQASVADNVTTDRQGEVVVPISSTVAGESILTAEIAGNGKREIVLTFVPNPGSAEITDANLLVTPESSLADGKTQKDVSAVVTDAQGNPVPGIAVKFQVDNGATLGAKAVTTDKQGRANTTLTSVVAGKTTVTAEVNKKRTTKSTTFIGNSATAVVSSVTPSKGPYIADGSTEATFSALVVDKNGNPLPNVVVDWKSDRDSSQVKFGSVQNTTDSKGIARTTLTSTRAFAVAVTASTNASSLTASPITFAADTSAGVITQLTSDRQTVSASGKDAATFTAKVEDTFGNPLANVAVTLSASNGATIAQSGTLTDKEGVVTATLVTERAGNITVKAELKNGRSKTASLTAKADIQTASVSLAASAESVTSGDTAGVTLTATVVDAHNNPVANTSVAWRSDHNDVASDVSLTDEQGKATMKLSGTLAGVTRVSAVLFNGETSNKNIIFTPAQPDEALSEFTLSPQSITADGITQATAILTLKDKWGNTVPGQKVAYSGNEVSLAFSDQTEKGNGIYQAKVSGKKEGDWTLTAKSGPVTKTTRLGVLANQTAAVIKSVNIVGTDTAKANGQESILVRVQVTDNNGNSKLPDVAVGWQTTLGTLSSPLSKTNAEGIAEIKVASTQTGQAKISAILGGAEFVSADKMATFTAGGVSAGTSGISVSPATVVAEAEKSAVVVTLRDEKGNLLTGLADTLSLQFSTDLSFTQQAFVELSQGHYQALVTGKKAGTAEVTALSNQLAIKQTGRLTLLADNGSAKVNGQISVSKTSATVGQSVTYSAILTDKNGNGLGAGIPVTWSANEGSVLGEQVTTTDASGKASVSLTRDLAGIAQVKAILPSGSTEAPVVQFSADVADEKRSELTLAPGSIVAGKDTALLALVLRDKNGNLLSKQTVEGKADSGDIAIAKSTEAKAGYYSMEVTGKRAGTATLSIVVNGVTFSEKKTLKVTGDTSSWSISNVAPDKSSMTAGDSKGVTYSASVVDAFGNKLSGVVVSWQLSGQAESFAPTSRTDEKGVATTTVKSTRAGKLLMTAWLDDSQHAQAAQVEVVPAAIETARSTFTANKTLIDSDGKDSSTLTVTLKDKFDNPVSGKALTIEGANTLPGTQVSKVSDKGNGIYQAQVSSTVKGEVSLNAKVEGKTIGSAIVITVGALTPDLRFDNALQEVTYTRNFTKSQTVKGVPEGVAHMWSSSEPDVASVDGSTGKVTLLKAGKATITIQTASNGQFNPASASYQIVVAKADPAMTAGDGNPIAASWKDGKNHTVAAKFANPDVGTALTAQYQSKNTAVAKVGSDGRIEAVKPGTASIIVSTPETDQFKAASATVPYVLNKATIGISFANPLVKTTDEDEFTLQSSVTAPPSDAAIQWMSSNSKVVNISGSGDIQGEVGKGQTRLTLAVAANDYYNASAGYYDVMVYTKPSISLGNITFVSKGNKGNSDTWTPVFTDDALSATWSADTSDEFSKPESVILYLKDTNGRVLAEINEKSPSGSMTTIVNPNTSLWGKTVHVELVANGHADLSTSIISDKKISVKNLTPKEIWSDFTAKSIFKIRQVFSDGSMQWDYNCGGWDTRDILFYIKNDTSVSFSGHRLLKPMTLSYSLTQNASIRTPGNFTISGDTSGLGFNDNDIQGYTSKIIAECTKSSVGGTAIVLNISYDGVTYRYKSEDYGVGGNGDGIDSIRTENRWSSY